MADRLMAKAGVMFWIGQQVMIDGEPQTIRAVSLAIDLPKICYWTGQGFYTAERIRPYC